MNPVIDLLRRRFATRAIQPDPPDDETIADLVEATRLTPSCYNNQPWRFLFARSEAARARVIDCLSEGNRVWAARAPLFVVGYARKADDCVIDDGRAYYQFDLGMAVMNLMLAATARGLVARPMAGYSPEKIRVAFALTPEDEPLVVVAVGQPSSDESHLPEHYRGLGKAPRQRRPAEEIVRFL